LKLGEALKRVGFVCLRQGRLEQARSVHAEASALIGRSNLLKLRMLLYEKLGADALEAGEIALGRTYVTQMLDMTRALGSRHAARASSLLSLVEYMAGDVDREIEAGRQAVHEARAVSGILLAYTLVNLADYLLARGDAGEARDCLEEAFARFAEAGSHSPTDLEVWAGLACHEGRLADAARLIGFVDAERTRAARSREATEERFYRELSRRLDAGLPAAELASLKDEGASWTKPEAVEFVRRRLLSPDSGGCD
jgi:tetratricopeptide (TPR) repeat protein